MTDQKKASISSPPRSSHVYVIRYQMPWQRTVQRDVLLSGAAAERKAERLREKGAEVSVWSAPCGPWS